MFGALPICRVCLKTSLEYIDFDTPFEVESNKEIGNDLTYLDCFLACTRLEIDLTESCPQSLCSACGLELKIAYEFLQKAESADRALREFAANTKVEKFDEEVTFRFQEAASTSQVDEKKHNVLTESQDDEEKSFVCTLCGEQFFSQFVLNLHVNRSHTNETAQTESAPSKVECQVCDLVVPLNTLQSHMQTHEETNSVGSDSESNAHNDVNVLDEEAEFELLDMAEGDSTLGMEELSPATESQDGYEALQADDDATDEMATREDEDQLGERPALDPDSKFSAMDKILTSEEKSRLTKPAYMRCTICHRHVRSVSYETHMNIHNGIRQFACQYCPDTFFSKRSLQSHTKTNHKEHLKSVCRICEEIVDSQEMKVHIQERHNRSVKCLKCDYEGLETKMREHVRRRHGDSRDFLCNICSKTFCTLGILNAHLKYHERKESKIKSDACKVCGKVFSTNHYLKAHLLTHMDERENFECHYCEKTYRSKAALENHMRMHKGETLKCMMCTKRFARQYELNVHMRFHTKEYPFECDICGKKFAIKGHLRTHMWRHQGLKLQCEECGKLFTSTKALQEHSFCHSEMPYPCPYCTKAYPSKPKFKVHLKTAHMVEFTNEELQKMCKFPPPKRDRSKKFTLVQADTIMKEVEVHTKEEEEIFGDA